MMIPVNGTGYFPDLQDIPESVWILLAKLFGAAAGSAISIAYVLPSGKREAFIRLSVGLGVGIIFGSATGHALAEHFGVAEKLTVIEIALSGSAAASLCAWWGLGVLSRFARFHGTKRIER